MRDFLLLCNRPAAGSNASTIMEHLDAIHAMPGFRVWEVSMIGALPAFIDLDRFDAVGIHYSLHLSDPTDHFLSREAMDRLSRFKGFKCIWMHDEYRNVDATLEKLAHIGIDTIFTVIPEETAERVYGNGRLPGVKVVTVLTGYVSEEIRSIRVEPDRPRPIDVGYRARRPPFWLGALAYEKITIGLRFLEEGKRFGLKMDISVEEADRIYGDEWLDFLKDSRASLCVESGASIIDFSGGIERQVQDHVRAHPEATFEEVAALFLKDRDGVDVINCISPRMFEAAACRTLIVAHPGEYSGLVEPWAHYVPLEKDFSNMDEVARALRSPEIYEPILDRAYDDLIGSGRFEYEAFSELCAGHIEPRKAPERRYSRALFAAHLHFSPSYLTRNYLAHFFQRFILASPLRRTLISVWNVLPEGLQTFVKPALRLIGR